MGKVWNILLIFSLCCVIPINGFSQDHDTFQKSLNKHSKGDLKELPIVTDFPPPPPPPPPPVVDEIFIRTRRSHLCFAACEDQSLSNKDLEKCAKDEMLCCIYESLESAIGEVSECIVGMMVVHILINEEGAIENARIVRGLDEELDNAVLEVLMKMTFEMTWVKPLARGYSSRIQYTLPIKF